MLLETSQAFDAILSGLKLSIRSLINDHGEDQKVRQQAFNDKVKELSSSAIEEFHDNLNRIESEHEQMHSERLDSIILELSQTIQGYMQRVYDQFDVVNDWFDEQVLNLSEVKIEEYRAQLE